MGNAVLGRQLVVTVNNAVGTMAQVSGAISALGINLLAVCAYGVDNKGVIMFVCDNSGQAKRALQKKGYDVREEKVILLTLGNEPGALQTVTEKIAEADVDLNLLYGSVEQKGKNTLIVLISEDNETVLKILKVT